MKRAPAAARARRKLVGRGKLHHVAALLAAERAGPRQGPRRQGFHLHSLFRGCSGPVDGRRYCIIRAVNRPGCLIWLVDQAFCSPRWTWFVESSHYPQIPDRPHAASTPMRRAAGGRRRAGGAKPAPWPVLGLSEPDLEIELLRKSVGALPPASALRRLRPHAAGRRAHVPLRRRRASASCAGRARAAEPERTRSSTTPSAATRSSAGPPDRAALDSRAVDPVSVSHIARPREEVFEYLADIANHAEFTDHYMVDWRLTREDSYGSGAGARFRVKTPFNRFAWADATFVEVERPRRIVEPGRRQVQPRPHARGLRARGVGGTTRVTFTLETEPKTAVGQAAGDLRRPRVLQAQSEKSLRRLRAILEEDRDRGARAVAAARACPPPVRRPTDRIRCAASASSSSPLVALAAPPSPPAATRRRSPRAKTEGVYVTPAT